MTMRNWLACSLAAAATLTAGSASAFRLNQPDGDRDIIYSIITETSLGYLFSNPGGAAVSMIDDDGLDD